ncbi:hypothetical protein [Nocardia sp. NPDC050710]|uniref:hypothetical protein n=1 Tax=Nocardia sp. NPDC050710 TaxID=3157220 RepID=UPI0033DCBE00
MGSSVAKICYRAVVSNSGAVDIVVVDYAMSGLRTRAEAPVNRNRIGQLPGGRAMGHRGMDLVVLPRPAAASA